MELVHHPNRSQAQQTPAQILVVAGGEHTSAVLAKANNRFGFGIRQPVTDVHRHQPQLVVVQLVNTTEHRVVAATVGAVTGDHIVARTP